MVGQRRMQRPALPRRHEVLALLLGQRRVEAVAVVDPSQGADPVPAVLGPEIGDEGELHVAPGLDLLFQEALVVAVIQVVEDGLAIGVLARRPPW